MSLNTGNLKSYFVFIYHYIPINDIFVVHLQRSRI